ncbi:MAG: hypothetical protein LIO65_00990 [Odoribacter sp.]|nr:hypothetical protein [Odoribacter sp.]
MKNIYLIISILALMVIGACDDKWDSHYSEDVLTSINVEIVNTDAIDFLKNEASYSELYKVFEETGIIDSMKYKDQEFTILVYNNEVMNTVTTNDWSYFAKTSISDIAYAPAKLTDGLRILMWHNKYLVINVDINAEGTKDIAFDGSDVSRIIKVNNGYIYQLDEPIFTPKSMYQTLEDLGEDYSIFKDMIMSKNQRVFDASKSIPTGVNNAGQTVYDSVFVIENPLYSTFNFSDEYTTGTILIPSNEVINNALAMAKATLASWNMTRTDSALNDWILKACFYNRVLMPEDFASDDINSAFSKVWRPTVQKVDLANPITLSNRMAYYITELKIPGHQLIYRIKHFFHYWTRCTQVEKDEYFKWTNIDLSSVNVKTGDSYDVAPWTPAPGIWPEIYNRCLYASLDDYDYPYSLDFTTLFLNETGDGVVEAMIPPGEYRLNMGFRQHSNLQYYNLNIYVNGEYVNQIYLGNSTTFHYDRNGEGYPEGYTLGGNYDRDGGFVGIITIRGTEPQKMILRMEAAEPLPYTNMQFDGHHWCLRPTNNHY